MIVLEQGNQLWLPNHNYDQTNSGVFCCMSRSVHSVKKTFHVFAIYSEKNTEEKHDFFFFEKLAVIFVFGVWH